MREYNIGWGLLRPLLCFCVILAHFWNRVPEDLYTWKCPFVLLLSFAVPIFYFWAFYFGSRHIMNGDTAYLKRRLRRLAIPFLGWGVIYYCVFVTLPLAGNFPDVPLTELGWQLLTGHSRYLNTSMWSQIDMIMITLLLFYIFSRAGKYTLWVAAGMLAAALTVQLTGANEAMFGSMRYEVRYTLGRIAEILPFGIVGYIFGRYDIPKKNGRNLWIGILLLSVAFLLMLPVLGHKGDGFGYMTIYFMPAALCLILAFWHLPAWNISAKAEAAIKFLTSYTLGIYCMHTLAYPFVVAAVKRVNPGMDSFFICVLTYLLCFVVAHLIAKIPWKHASMLVK